MSHARRPLACDGFGQRLLLLRDARIFNRFRNVVDTSVKALILVELYFPDA